MTVSSVPGYSFLAWPSFEVRYGVRIFAGTDIDAKAKDELVVGAGPDPSVAAAVKVFLYNESQVMEWFSLQAFPTGCSISVDASRTFCLAPTLEMKVVFNKAHQLSPNP